MVTHPLCVATPPGFLVDHDEMIYHVLEDVEKFLNRIKTDCVDPLCSELASASLSP